MFGSGTNADGGSGNGPTVLTVEEVCEQEFQRFQERFKDTRVADYPMEEHLPFWAKKGKALYPNMARVAQVLLSVPGSLGVLERDFSTAGRLITGPRSRLNGGHPEMVLFLNGNQEHMPTEVPALSTEQGLEAVPKRLSNPRKEAESLSLGQVVQDDNGDDYAEEIVELDVMESCM